MPINRDIDRIVGGPEDTMLGTVRDVNEELNNELFKQQSLIDSKARENDRAIAEQLVEHDWGKEEIRRVLYQKTHKGELTPKKTDYRYFNGVLRDAGYENPSGGDDGNDGEFDLDMDDGSTTDNSESYLSFSDF